MKNVLHAFTLVTLVLASAPASSTGQTDRDQRRRSYDRFRVKYWMTALGLLIRDSLDVGSWPPAALETKALIWKHAL